MMENKKLIKEAGYPILNEFALKHLEIKPNKNGSLAEQVIDAWCELKVNGEFFKTGTTEANNFIRMIDIIITPHKTVE